MEDDPALRSYLVDTIEAAGYEVCGAENGRAGLQRYEEFCPNLVLCDVRMPGMDGLEFLTTLRQRGENVFVVMMTAYGCEEYAVRSLRAGANDYLNKPVRHSELLPLLKKYAEYSLEDRPADLVQMNERLLDNNLTLRRELKKQADLLVQSDKMTSLGMLSADIAHEISNSMLLVVTSLSCLKDSSGEVKEIFDKYKAIEAGLRQKDNLESMRRNVEELIKNKQLVVAIEEIRELVDEVTEGALEIDVLLKNMKNFSRMGTEERIPVNLHERIDLVLKMIHPRIVDRIKTVKDYGELPLVKCSSPKIGQAIMNILLNAEQAISGKGVITITTRALPVASGAGEPRVEMVFSDTGCGIDKESLQKIFEPFYTTKPVGQGTGLGLKITREIITDHGGTITFQSVKGRGTTVRIRLPVGNGGQ